MSDKPTALITGAGRGLGKAIATRLHGDGYSIVVLDSDKESGQNTAEQFAGRFFEADVSDVEQVVAVAAQLDRLDVLVNNAGIWRIGPFAQATAQEFLDVLKVNVLGTVLCTQAFAPLLASRGDHGRAGAIVNLSSAAAATNSPGLGTYPASKAGVETLTRQHALELAPHVRVNAIAPGLIVTEGTGTNYEGDAADQRAKAVPLRRVGGPEDIADVAGFLVSNDARYVTGQVIYVDGGISAGRAGV